MTSNALRTSPLAVGARVSLELPEAGTCVAEVARLEGPRVVLSLLDEAPPGQLAQQAALDLFLPRPEGVYRWACTVASEPQAGRVELLVAGSALFIQRRMGLRVGTGLEAEVRREHSARRGRPYPARVTDVSRGGLRMETAANVSVGDTLEVAMDLEGSPLRVTGRVVMARPGPRPDSQRLVHLSFLADQLEAKERIARFVGAHLGANAFNR